jgi:hypothetical protein
MRSKWLLMMASLMVIAPAAHADSIQLTIDTSAVINVYSNSDVWGYWVNLPNGNVDEDLNPEFFGYTTLPIQELSVSVPTGSVITSAIAFFYLANNGQIAGGTGSISYEGDFDLPFTPNPDEPSVAPIFGPGTFSINASFEQCGCGIGATIDGDNAYYDPQTLEIMYAGNLYAPLEVPGSNWVGWLGASGQVDVSYVEQLDVTYTPAPTPEPSTLALLATGISGLAGVGLRRRSREQV